METLVPSFVHWPRLRSFRSYARSSAARAFSRAPTLLRAPAASILRFGSTSRRGREVSHRRLTARRPRADSDAASARHVGPPRT